MEITIIIGLVTIWLTMFGFMFTIINGQRDLRRDLEKKIEASIDSLRKDLEQKIEVSINSLRQETEGSINSLKEEIRGVRREIDSIKEEIRDIRKEIASLYRILISQNRYDDNPEDQKVA